MGFSEKLIQIDLEDFSNHLNSSVYYKCQGESNTQVPSLKRKKQSMTNKKELAKTAISAFADAVKSMHDYDNSDDAAYELIVSAMNFVQTWVGPWSEKSTDETNAFLSAANKYINVHLAENDD